jgi:hypothetical protein
VKPVPVLELLTWFKADPVSIWEFANVAGLEEGASADELRHRVRAMIEKPLRLGLIRAVNVYHGTEKYKYDEIGLPVDKVLELVDRVIPILDTLDFVELDLWFDWTPKGEAYLRAHEDGDAALGSEQ